MKKILFALLAVVLLMSACSKDETHPLAGTEWSENFQRNEDGIKYNFMMKLSFIDAKIATIQNKMTGEHISSTTDITAQYTYDNTTKKGTITTISAEENATVPFEINGNKLSLTVDIEDNEIVVLTRTK